MDGFIKKHTHIRTIITLCTLVGMLSFKAAHAMHHNNPIVTQQPSGNELPALLSKIAKLLPDASTHSIKNASFLSFLASRPKPIMKKIIACFRVAPDIVASLENYKKQLTFLDDHDGVTQAINTVCEKFQECSRSMQNTMIRICRNIETQWVVDTVKKYDPYEIGQLKLLQEYQLSRKLMRLIHDDSIAHEPLDKNSGLFAVMKQAIGHKKQLDFFKALFQLEILNMNDDVLKNKNVFRMPQNFNHSVLIPIVNAALTTTDTPINYQSVIQELCRHHSEMHDNNLDKIFFSNIPKTVFCEHFDDVVSLALYNNNGATCLGVLEKRFPKFTERYEKLRGKSILPLFHVNGPHQASPYNNTMHWLVNHTSFPLPDQTCHYLINKSETDAELENIISKSWGSEIPIDTKYLPWEKQALIHTLSSKMFHNLLPKVALYNVQQIITMIGHYAGLVPQKNDLIEHFIIQLYDNIGKFVDEKYKITKIARDFITKYAKELFSAKPNDKGETILHRLITATGHCYAHKVTNQVVELLSQACPKEYQEILKTVDGEGNNPLLKHVLAMTDIDYTILPKGQSESIDNFLLLLAGNNQSIAKQAASYAVVKSFEEKYISRNGAQRPRGDEIMVTMMLAALRKFPTVITEPYTINDLDPRLRKECASAFSSKNQTLTLHQLAQWKCNHEKNKAFVDDKDKERHGLMLQSIQKTLALALAPQTSTQPTT